MAWDHLSITRPHLVYIILGGFTSLFMLCSSVIKERMYIGEATVATLCGVIFGPHAANLINPDSWGSVDIITIEFSRIVLVVQCFAVGVELPRYYMERHWKSVVFLLVPVMTFGWLVTSLIIWWMVPVLSWLESLAVAACVTATDPVLASSVVGKGKFAKRVPKHLRDLLSAESGCNDGMAFPFIYLSLYLILENLDARQVTFHWLVYTVLYECIFGAFYGFVIGYIGRHGIKYAERHELIDRESFLVFYFTLALFCAGSGSILGVDDLLVGFAAGVGFSNDGWFHHKTEESHVSNVIDLLINLAYFVYFGTIVPWEQFNNEVVGLTAWRLVVIAIFVILFRRIPVMMALKPFIPDVKTYREALFAGHFGPIGVGAIFVAMLARAELETDTPVPLSELPPPDAEHFVLLTLVWPVVSFLVISSILIHGSSIAVFTLGKHINTLTVTLSYTQAPEEGPSWMNRLPRISSQSKSQTRMSDTDVDDLEFPEAPPGTLPPIGFRGQFLRRQREEDTPGKVGGRASSLVTRRKKKHWDDGVGPGGPVTQSAIFPQSRSDQLALMSLTDSTRQNSQQEKSDTPNEESSSPSQQDSVEEYTEKADDINQPDTEVQPSGGPTPRVEVFDERDHIIIEDQQGQVLAVETPTDSAGGVRDVKELKEKVKNEASRPGWTYESLRKRLAEFRDEEKTKRMEKSNKPKHEPARAFQFGNTIIVEDEDGEVVKQYDLPPSEKAEGGSDFVAKGLGYVGMGGWVRPPNKPAEGGEPSDVEGQAGPSRPPLRRPRRSSFAGWAGRSRGAAGDTPAQQRNKGGANAEEEPQHTRHVRFTVGGTDRRMTEADFLEEVKKLDAKTRRDVVDTSTAPQDVKSAAKWQLLAAEAGARAPSAVGEAGPSRTGERTRARSQSPARSRRPSPGGSGQRPDLPGRTRSGTDPSEAPPHGVSSADAPETAAERRRRLAALSSIRDDDDANETPAERRRREAALGLGGGAANDSDSDDDDTPRVPPARRGIRFADVPSRGRD